MDSVDTSDPSAVLGLLPPWHPAHPRNRGSPGAGLRPCGPVAASADVTDASAADAPPPLTPEGEASEDAAAFLAARAAQPALADWALLLLDRLLALVEHKEKAAKKGGPQKPAGSVDSASVSQAVAGLLPLLFAQMSPALQRKALRRVEAWLGAVSCKDNLKEVQGLLTACTAAEPGLAVARCVSDPGEGREATLAHPRRPFPGPPAGCFL